MIYRIFFNDINVKEIYEHGNESDEEPDVDDIDLTNKVMILGTSLIIITYFYL